MKKIEIDSFSKYRYPGQVTRSPEGRYLAYTITDVNLEKNQYQSHIHVKDLHENKDYQLTNGSKGERSFQFLDEKRILFQSDREQGEKETEFQPRSYFYQIRLAGGEACLDLTIPLEVQKLHPITGDDFLLQAVYNPVLDQLDGLEGEEKDKTINQLKENQDYEVMTEIPFWSDGGSFLQGKRNRIYRYARGADQAEGLSDETADTYGLTLSDDKSKALFLQSKYNDKLPLSSELMLLDLSTNEVKDISPFEDFSYHDAVFVGEGITFCGNDRKTYGINQDSDIYYLSLPDLNVRKIVADDFNISLGNSVGSDARQGGGRQIKGTADAFYFISTEGINSHLNRIDTEGNLSRLTETEGSVECFDVFNDEIHLVAFRELRLAEIYALATDRVELPVSNLNPDQDEYELAKLEHFTLQFGDDELPSFVLLPPSYNPNQQYPAILTIHGGPKTVFGSVFFHEMQYLAAGGYILFFTNPRGSDGYGKDWADIRGRYGEIEYEQLMALTDEVCKRYPSVDRRRVGVTGGSYGGFMTNWIVGHTDRFAAAVTQRSISNMISMWGISDIGYYFINDQSAADPWSDATELWRQSPLKYADQIKTPTLILHSDQDYRCPVAEGMQLFTALKYHGVESKMVLFKGESHGLSRGGKPKHRIRRLSEIKGWFDKYLK